jgi:hypothetical protein
MIQTKTLLFLFATLLVGSQGWSATDTIIVHDSIKVIINEAAFDSSSAHMQFCKSGTQRVVCRINGGSVYGADLDLPKTYVKSIVLKVGKKSYNLDCSYMYNAWGKRSNDKKMKYLGAHFYDSDNGAVRAIFSDAGCSFVAQWQVSGGIPFRDVLTSDIDIVGLFVKQIDPPAFE